MDREAQEQDWDESTDVIVVGAGYAGVAAAIEARRAGASVLVLEKMRACGGNSIISGGLIAAAGTPLQKRLGVEDSADLMFEDMLRTGLGLNHPGLARTVADRSAATLQWTIDELGMSYLAKLEYLGGHSVPRTHVMPHYSGMALMKLLLTRARGLDVQIRTGAYLETLVRPQDGRVQGVRVRAGYVYPNAASGVSRTIAARRAVILATGGFAEDLPFRVAQDPRLTAGVETTKHIFAGLLKGGPDMTEALDEALLADDDDGNLANGTPNECAIVNGFTATVSRAGGSVGKYSP